jgi:hypothetical protein
MKNIGGDTEEHGRRILETMERDMEGENGRMEKETWKVGYDMEEHRRRP